MVHRLAFGGRAAALGHNIPHDSQLANGLIQRRIGLPDRRNESGGPFEVQLTRVEPSRLFFRSRERCIACARAASESHPTRSAISSYVIQICGMAQSPVIEGKTGRIW
jgi:hypothetical protein